MSTTVSLLDTPPTTRPDDGFGALSTSQGNLPLEKLDVWISTVGLAVRTELTQVFRNPYDEPLEATYIFPLPDRAGVTSLRMEADDRTVEGVLREREQARAAYDRAIGEGKRASIAEEERPGVFTMRVGNILPGEQVSIRLTLAGRLGYEDGEALVRFPLVVAPRYIPGRPLPGAPVGTGTEFDTDQVPDASRITPPVLLPGFPSPVELSITAEIDPAGIPLTNVASSLHPIATDEGDVPPAQGGRLTVRVHPGERADRDFILRLGLGSGDAVTSSLVLVPDAPGGSEAEHLSGGRSGDSDSDSGPGDEPQGQQAEFGDGTFALTVLPPALTTMPRPRDVVFVLDRSGSMGGMKMVAARRAAARIIDTLTGSDRFTVLAFDNKVETPPDLHDGPDGMVEASDRNRFRAVEYLARLEARGGTEMLRPLLRAADLLSRAPAPGREPVLVLLTDGQVGNEDQILRDLAERLTDARIHTVGVDVAVNEAFLRRLAMLGGGHYELVESEDRLDQAMEAIHRRIGTPLVTDLALTPDGLDVLTDTLTPVPLPALYEGAALLITGRYRGLADGGEITVSGRTADGSPWSDRLPARQGATGSGGPEGSTDRRTTGDAALSAVWARARLRDLEDRYVTVRSGRRRDPALDDLERRIVATSLRFGVLCRFTAYVAIDSRVVNEGGELRRVTQPVDLPRGWDPAALGGPPAMRAAAMPMSAGTARPAMAALAAPGGLPPTPTMESFTSRAREVAGRLGQPHRRAGHGPRRAELPAAESPALGEVAEEYLPRLRGAEPAGRRALLLEIRARLERLLPELNRPGVGVLILRPVEQLVADLRSYERLEAPSPGETERLRLRVLDVLAAFNPDGSRPKSGPDERNPNKPGPHEPGPRPERKRFWSR